MQKVINLLQRNYQQLLTHKQLGVDKIYCKILIVQPKSNNSNRLIYTRILLLDLGSYQANQNYFLLIHHLKKDMRLKSQGVCQWCTRCQTEKRLSELLGLELKTIPVLLTEIDFRLKGKRLRKAALLSKTNNKAIGVVARLYLQSVLKHKKVSASSQSWLLQGVV